jgi:transglutaminase-like putative cysteine protease
LSDSRIWDDVFSCDLPDTASDLDYLHFNMCGTLQVTGWSYGTYAIFEFNQSFWTTAAQEAYVDDTVRAVLKSLLTDEDSQAEKIRAIHDYITGHVEYDSSLTKFSAYDALYSQKAVCNGYTLLLYKMLLEAGIPARAVSASALTGAPEKITPGTLFRSAGIGTTSTPPGTIPPDAGLFFEKQRVLRRPYPRQ